MLDDINSNQMSIDAKYKLFRLCCLAPFYFGLISLISFFVIKGHPLFDFDTIPPRLPSEPIITTSKIIFEQIFARLFFSHFIALILYCVISFPFMIYLARNLYKCYPTKKNIILLLIAYFLLPTVLLFLGVRI